MISNSKDCSQLFNALSVLHALAFNPQNNPVITHILQMTLRCAEDKINYKGYFSVKQNIQLKKV